MKHREPLPALGREYPPACPGPVAVTRDGKVVTVVRDCDEAFAAIQRRQSQSVAWATMHEGWSWRTATPAEVAHADAPRCKGCNGPIDAGRILAAAGYCRDCEPTP